VAQKAIQENQSALLRDPDSPIAGNPDGDVTIVEFSDYQCPYCKRAHAAVNSVVAADGKVKVVYKDLPILGEASRIAALAALASRAQGKHPAFHDALMEYSGKIDRDKIMEIAGSVGLDVALLQKAMDDPKLKQIIERNMTLASALGVRGTPAFVVGNQFVPGAVDADALKQLIADARKRS
jgi:protein-disulfide isomerase